MNHTGVGSGITFTDSGVNYWNISKTAATNKNILGGPFLGGNYWTNISGTGFSDTCNDIDHDGLCDTSFDMGSDNYDNYSIVASCTIFNQDGYVWILTREQNPNVELIETLKNKTISMGFTNTDLIQSYQGPECNEKYFTLLNVNNNNSNDDCCLDGNCCHGVEYCCDECYGSCRCSVGGKCH